MTHIGGKQLRRGGTAGASELIAVLLLSASAMVSCGPAERQGDSPPGERSSSGSPSRIVSLVPAVTEMLFAIGAGDLVAGVSSFDRHPPEVEALPKVGALLDPDIERIAVLRPDLLVLYASQSELRAHIDSMGIGVYEYRHAGLGDVTSTIRELGAIIGGDARRKAEAVATDLESRLADIRSRSAGKERTPTLLVFGREPGSLRNVLASGGVGFLADLLDVAGGNNVFGAVARESVPATTEAVLASAPEVIIELLPSTSTEDFARSARQTWESASALPAVRNGRVFVLVGDQYVVPGPRLAEAAEAFWAAIHGTREQD
ncbi:MAG: ABC transporter substrate-binding protein [Vicinamibacterales bacterium]